MTTEKPKAKRIVAKTPKQAELKLEEWPDRVRGVPNVILRSALFSISQTRLMFSRLTPIASLDGIEIRFRGEQFNQDDLDVWETLVHRARKQPLGTYVRFTVNDILRELGRKTGGAQHAQLQEELARLMGGVIELRWPDEAKKLTDKLIIKSFYDEVSETYVLMLSEDLLKIYKAGYSYIDWEERKLYKKNALARYLHGFYTSHADPYALKVETIRDLCGSKKEQRLGDFRKALRIALDLLVDNKSLISASINEARDVVEVKKIPTASQRRYLEKKQGPGDNKQAGQNALDFDSNEQF